MGAILSGDSERLAQYGGRGGFPGGGTPGMSHWYQRAGRGPGGQNDFSIDRSFDTMLQKGRRPLPVDNHNIESRLEPFHANAEEDSLGYVLDQEQRKRWRIKQQIRQKMINLANDSKGQESDEGYPEVQPMERMLSERHKNDNLQFSDVPAEQVKPSRRHYAQRSIFDMNKDGAVLRRTPTTTDATEFVTDQEFERDPIDKFKKRTVGLGSTPMVGDPYMETTTFNDFDQQLRDLSKEWTHGQGDGLFHERTLAFGDGYGDDQYADGDQGNGNPMAVDEAEDDMDATLDKMLATPKHTGNLEKDLDADRRYQEEINKRLRRKRGLRVQTLHPGGPPDADTLKHGPDRGKFVSWDGNADLYHGGSGLGTHGLPWSPRS